MIVCPCFLILTLCFRSSCLFSSPFYVCFQSRSAFLRVTHLDSQSRRAAQCFFLSESLAASLSRQDAITRCRLAPPGSDGDPACRSMVIMTFCCPSYSCEFSDPRFVEYPAALCQGRYHSILPLEQKTTLGSTRGTSSSSMPHSFSASFLSGRSSSASSSSSLSSTGSGISLYGCARSHVMKVIDSMDGLAYAVTRLEGGSAASLSLEFARSCVEPWVQLMQVRLFTLL